MTATVSLEPFASATLTPGHYWIEIASERPMGKAALAEALASMGLSRVRFEHKDPAAVPSGWRVGLRGPEPLGSTSAVPTTSAMTPTRITQALAAPLAPTITQAQAKVVAQVATAAAAPVQKTPIATAAMNPDAAALLGLGAKTAPAPAPRPAASFAVPAKPSGPSYAVPGSGQAPAPASAAYDPPVYQAYQSPEPEPAPSYSMAWDEQELAGAPATSPMERAGRTAESVAAVAPPLRPSKGIAVGPGCTLLNPGSQSPMYLCPASSGRSSFGATAAPGTRVVRFVAHAARPVSLTSTDALRFQAIHKLAFDPSAPLQDEPRGPRLRTQSFGLNTGVVYDLRFLSRDKTARSKEGVVALLDAMGFAPAEVMLLARNLRVPGRPATSLSEWLGVGTWRAPASIVTSDDPFYFAEARPSP